jgi:hypothetical protein
MGWIVFNGFWFSIFFQNPIINFLQQHTWSQYTPPSHKSTEWASNDDPSFKILFINFLLTSQFFLQPSWKFNWNFHFWENESFNYFSSLSNIIFYRSWLERSKSDVLIKLLDGGSLLWVVGRFWEFYQNESILFWWETHYPLNQFLQDPRDTGARVKSSPQSIYEKPQILPGHQNNQNYSKVNHLFHASFIKLQVSERQWNA